MMIDITGVNIVKLVKKAYELSRPQGFGMLHFDSTPLTDEEAQSFIESDGTVSLDYVKGRACKFNVSNNDGNLSIRDPWYDHSDDQLYQLLAHVGITYKIGQNEHGCACNCDNCRIKQGKEALGSAGGFE